MKTTPYAAQIPEGALIEQAVRQIDYQDTYAIQVDPSKAVPTEKLIPLFFDSFPNWARVLMGIRETLANWIGLKTAKGMDVAQQIKSFKGEVGQSIALFQVWGRTPQEILTGERDKHLDFGLSFFGIEKPECFEIRLSTIVQFNSWLGRVYFFPVGPIHRILVPAMLRRMAKKL